MCIGRLLLSFVAKQESEKTWRRVVGDSIFRWLVHMHPIPRLAFLMGHTQDIYTAWAKRNKRKTYIEDIGDNAKLLWILNEKVEEIPSRVILYLHGGGFYLPMFEDAASFWRHVQKELKDSHGLDVGVAILDYSKQNYLHKNLPGLNVPVALIPEANFPVPLLQTISAIKHLFSRGVQPSNLLLTGDSAGGNLTIQTLLHIIHPLPGLPTLSQPTMEEIKLAGAYLMSPWLTLLPRENSSKKCYQENAMWDVVSPAKLSDFGTGVLSEIKDEKDLAYIDSHFAPSDWYDDMGTVVKRILITAGRRECLREDIIKFGQQLERVAHKGDMVVKFGC